MKAFLLSIALVSQLIASGQQNPPARDTRTTPASNAAPTGTGVLSGVVTGSDDGRPVRHAYIVLIGTTTGIVKVSASDMDGRFSFSSLPVDRYTVGASKAPYLGMIAGARRPGRTGTPIAIAAGQKITDVAIKMARGGAITGTITDEKGQVVPGTMINLLQWRMQGSERALVSIPNYAITDDLGRYRIHGLQPGEYVLTAQRFGNPQATRALTAAEVDAALSGAPPPPATPPAPLRYAPVYFPGTTRVNEAMAVVLGAGEERANADFRLEAVRTGRVEGSVTTADGQPVGGMVMLMTVVSRDFYTGTSTRATPDGRFSATNVPPGEHVLILTGTGAQAGQYARAEIETTGADVFGVQLILKPALSFSGRLSFDSTSAAPSLAGRRVPMRSLGSRTGENFSVGPTNQTGVFTVNGVVPGRYVLGGTIGFGPTADTMTWSLQSVDVDGRDLTDLPIEITDTPPKSVVVTYTNRWQELSGRLQSSSGAPVSDFTIILFPEDKAYWFQGTRRIVTARPGTDGRFTLSGKGPSTLPPGKYLLAAVTDVGRDEQFDPAFLAQIVPAAIPISLGPGEKKVQDLAIK